MTKQKGRRINTYFRQSAKAFRVARQTQVFYHLKRNIPYNMYKFSRSHFTKQLTNIKSKFSRGVQLPEKKKY